MHIQGIKRHYFSDRGVGIVAVLMIVVVLGIMGGVVTHFVATGAVSKTNDLVREQAFDLTHAGFEYALKRLDDGVDPDGETKDLGSGQFTVDYDDTTGVITVSSDVSAMYGSSNPTYTIQGPASGGNMADCLEVGTTTANLQITAGKTQLQDLTLENTCSSDITIDGMIVTTNPSGSEDINLIRIKNVNVFNEPPKIAMGNVIDFDEGKEHTISPCSTDDFKYVRFDATIVDRNYNLTFIMQDGTQKTAFVQFVADDEAACLNIDLSPPGVYVGYAGSVRLLGGTLTNSCTAPTEIEITAMTVSYTPTSPSRNLIAIDLGASGTEWTGSVGNGVQAVFTNTQLIPGSSSITQNYLNFSSDMRGYNYSITYTMSDSTIATAAANLYESDMGPCLTVDTSGMSMGGGNKKLQDQVWGNSCSLRTLVDQVETSWSGAPSGTDLTRIKVNGSTVWNGTASSGDTVDIDNTDISGSGSVSVDEYTFDKKVNGCCFSHVITMLDGDTVNVPSYCP